MLVALNESIAKTVSSSTVIEFCTLLCLYDNKRHYRQDYCFRRVPIVGILMHCVIKVYNITEKKKMDDFKQRAMLSHARYFETLVKKRRIHFNYSPEIVS